MAAAQTSRTRDRMIDAALRLFHTEGFGAVGVHRLADEAGVSKRTLYSYFPTKDDILLGVLRLRGPEIAVDWLPAEDDDTSPIDRIRAVFRIQAASIGDTDFSGCPFVDIATEMRDPGHPAVIEAAKLKLELTKFFARQAKLAHADNSDQLAEQLTTLFNGAVSQALLFGAYPDSVFTAVDALIAAQHV
jgi:AcrR family transcriptional regulator